MNKNCYRVIFSRVRGVFIAVAENVRSRCKAAGQSESQVDIIESQVSDCKYSKLKLLHFAVMSVMGMIVYSVPLNSIANTQIVADPSAARSQQAQILNSANGTVQVNIQTPSRQGVSRNTFSQFDVGHEGAILNNARNNVQTQIGGWVQGNANLARGEAKVILNEVNSTRPSQLKGYIEVAGKQAQVVIANPAGLICDGCGVINADRFTLTSGQAVMNQGYLESFRVREGQVTISGKGLNGSLTPFTDIYAQALKVNAGLYAKDLNVVLGRNDISAQTHQQSAVASSNAPATASEPTNYALDVGKLGGMYAGKIFLLGTEQGMGVRNAGSVNTTTSTMQLSAQGDLTNTGNMIANQGEIDIKAAKINNSGNISGSQKQIQLQAKEIGNDGLIATSDQLKLTTQGELNNHGVLNAGRLALTAKSLNNDQGKIEQTGGQALAIKTKTLDNRQGLVGHAVKPKVETDPQQPEQQTPSISDPQAQSTAQDSSHVTLAPTEGSIAKPLADGLIDVTDGVSNVAGSIVNNGDIHLNVVDSIKNQAGQIQTPELKFKGQHFDNQDGKIIAQQIDINTQQINNQKGQLHAAQQLTLTTQQLNNQSGKINSQDSLSVNSEYINNKQGEIAGQRLNAVARHVDNTQGIVYATGKLGLDVGEQFINQSGLIAAQNQLEIDAQQLNNQSGKIRAEGDQLKVQIKQDLDNRSGEIFAAKDSNIHADSIDNQQGLIYSKQKIDVRAGGLNNRTGKIYAEAQAQLKIQGQLNNQDAVLAAKENLQIDSYGLNNQQGILRSEQASVELATHTQLNNQHGDIYAAKQLAIQSQGVDNRAGQIAAQAQLTLNSQKQLLDNQKGKLIAKVLHLDTGKLNNQAGLIQAEQSVDINSQQQAIINRQSGEQGGILSQGEINIHGASSLDNQDGYIASIGSSHIGAQQINNQAGKIISQTDLSLQQQSAQGQLNNQAGQISAQKNLSLKVDQLNNSGLDSHIVAGETLKIQSQKLDNSQNKTEQLNSGIEAKTIVLHGQSVNNQSGLIRASELAELEVSGQLDNQAGRISSTQKLEIGQANKSLNINNTDGELLANQQLTIQANQLINDGKIISAGDAQIALKQDFTHSKAGQIAANRKLKISTEQQFTNQSALVAGESIDLEAKNIENQAGASIISQHTKLSAVEQLHNQGLINGELTHIQAGRVWNEGARIYATKLAIQATQLDNVSNQAGVGAVIASRGDMDLGVTELNNHASAQVKDQARDNAWIYSAGNLRLGKTLDQNLKAQGQSTALYNSSAVLESAGNMDLNVAKIKNSNANLHIQRVEKNRQQVVEYGQDEQTWDASVVRLGKTKRGLSNAVLFVPDVEGGEPTRKIGEDWTLYEYTKVRSQDEVQSSSPAQIIAGGNLNLAAHTALENNDSQVIVGKSIIGDVDSIVNHSTPLYQVDHVEAGGSSRWHTVGFKKGLKKRHKHKWADRVSYQPADVVHTLSMNLAEVKEQQAVSSQNPSEQVATAAVDLKADQVQAATPAQHDAAELQQQQLLLESGDATDLQVRSVTQDQIKLPSNALFIQNQDSQAQYVVETDPAFSNYHQWLSSDYMFNAMGLDPALQQKRIGDGYYEQRLVQDQIVKLTGMRFLEGYGSDEEQYKALMDSGLSFAKQYNLRPGVALTDAQIAHLTSDIVWLEEKTVRLADGSTRKVLVPQVYVKGHVGDLKADGSLISADTIALSVHGDVVSSGTIAGRQALILDANNIALLNGKMQANQVALNTREDLNIIGGQVEAKDAVQLNVAGNFNLHSSTQSSENHVGDSSFSYTGIDRVAGIYSKTPLNTVSSDTEHLKTTVLIQVGGDSSIKGAEIVNANGSTVIQSKGNTTVEGVKTEVNNQGYADQNNYNYSKQQQDVSSVVQSHGNTVIQAENIAVKGSQISSEQGSTILTAQQKIDILEGRSVSDHEESAQVSSQGLLSSKVEQQHTHQLSNDAIASSIDGKKVVLDAKNINIQGSHVVSDELTQINAKENVSITGAENSYLNASEHSTKKSGLMASGGIGFSVGQNNELTAVKNSKKTNSGSMVGSLNGNTNISAGNNYQQTGSTVSSQMGDVNILAKHVNIEAAKEQSTSDYKHEMEQKGFTLAVNVPVVTAVQSAFNSIKQVGESKNDRVNAMATANAGFDSYQAGQSLSALKDAVGTASNASDLANAANVGVSLTYGSQKSTDYNHSQTNTASQSQVYAGAHSNIVATGAGEQSDINIVGSDVLGKTGTTLIADHDVNIKAAEQNTIETSGNKSVGWNAGVTVSSQAGFGVTAGGNLAKGKGNGTETSYVNSHVGSAESQTTIESGNTTNIIGGQVQGKGVEITANALNIESLQDKASYQSEQKNISAQVSVGTGGGSVSGSAGKSNIDANYASVNEQSGVYAGDDGYQIKVKNNTDLKGAIITSSESAERNNHNQVNTGTLTSQDIHNISEYDAKGIGISAGFNAGSNKQNGEKQVEKQADTVLKTPNKIDQHASSKLGITKSIGFGSDRAQDSSITRSGINSKHITITDELGQQSLTSKTVAQSKKDIYTSTTTETARADSGAIANNFDKDQVQKEINTQVSVTQKFGQNAPKAVADFADQQALKLQAQGNLKEAAKWAEGGAYRVAMHTAIGALSSGTVEGALATGSVAAAAPKIGQFQKNVSKALTNKGMSQTAAHSIANGVTTLTLMGAGITAGLDTGSAATAINVDANNRQLHRDEIDLIEELATQYAQAKGISIDEAKNLLTRGALYHIDQGWQDSIDKYKSEDIAKYKEAYQYLLSQTKDVSVIDLDSPLVPAQDENSMRQIADSSTVPQLKVIEVSAIDSYAGPLTDAEQSKADNYIYGVGQGFTATRQDFADKDVFLLNTLAGSSQKGNDKYNDKRAFVEKYGAIQRDEIGFFEDLRETVNMNLIAPPKGLVKGAVNGVVETVSAAVTFLKHPIDNTVALANAAKDAVLHPIDTADSIRHSIIEGAEKYYTKQDLYYMQQAHADAVEYDTSIAGEFVGGGVVGAVAKKGVKIAVREGIKKTEKVAVEVSETVKNSVSFCSGSACFTAGTLIETAQGLKPVDQFVGGELVWARNDTTLEYGYRPVIATKVTADQNIFSVTVQDQQGRTETLQTTAEHPFWIKEYGWLKASLLRPGMILLDRNNAALTIMSQALMPNQLETVYNIEVEGYHTYHVGELGIWVHNADCCTVTREHLEASYGKLHDKYFGPNGEIFGRDPVTNEWIQLNKVVDINGVPSVKDVLTGKWVDARTVHIETDHILPKKYFEEIPGFKTLPKKVQKDLMNDIDNLQPMYHSANRSKQNRVEHKDKLHFEKWKGVEVSDGYRQFLKTKQTEMEQKVQIEVKKYGNRVSK